MNAYTNTELREYISVNIRVCDNTIDGNCHSEAHIQEFLQNTRFTQFMTSYVAELGNQKTYDQNPIKPNDEFHSQYVLSFDKYRDNNNFLRINKVETKDSRVNIFHSPKKF